MTQTLPESSPLTQELRDAISDLFLEGRRVSEVIAHGLSRSPGWRRQHVIDILAARGWQLDSDGRIPRRFRPSALAPVTPLPGGPIPEPPRRPVVEFPERGTGTGGPRATQGPAALPQMLADGKGHGSARVRKLAEKAEVALRALSAALADEQEREGVRRRLAELDAEREALKAQLAGAARPKVTRAERGPAAAPSATSSINHGTWGGFLTEKRRGIEHCPACIRAKDQTMADRAAKRSEA